VNNITVRESVHLRIKYRMLREGRHTSNTKPCVSSLHGVEVESLVRQAVETVVTDTPSWLPHRKILIGRLIEVLESDAAWVEMYGITGTLHVPTLSSDEGELSEPLSKVYTLGNIYSSRLRLIQVILDRGVT
jgi:hypothetical protein